MADDIKIIVRADVSSVRDAEKAIKRFEGANKTLGRSILDVANKTKQVASGWQQANSLYKEGTINAKALKAAQTQLARELAVLNGYTTENGKLNTQRALAELKAAQAARDNAKATEEAARAAKESADAHERTRQRYVAGAAAQAQLKQAQRDLSAAYRAGVINIDEYRQALILLNQQNLGNRRSTNNLGVAMQQTGYQVGDFVVQVQSGQNPMVAFGQQATQLVGVLYLLPPAILASTRTILGLTFSVSALVMTLGIAIPVLTAIGAAYMRMKKDSDVAGKAADSLSEKMKSLASSVEDYRRSQEALSRGITVDQLISRTAVDEAKKRLDEAKENLAEVMGIVPTLAGQKAVALGVLFGPLAGFFDGSFEDLTEKEKEAVKRLTEATNTLKGVEDELAEQQKKRFDDQKFNLDQELALQQEIAKHGADSSKVKSLELEQQIASRHRDLEAQRESLALRGYDVDLLKQQVEETLRLEAANAKTGVDQEALEARKKSIAAFKDQIIAQANLLALLQIERDLGKDHADYRAELIAQEEARLRKLVEQKEITESQAKAALYLYEETLKVNGELEASANSANNLAAALKEAASAMSNLLNVGSLETKLAGLVAETNAIKTGADSASASLVAVELLKARKSRDAALEGGNLPSGAVNKAYQDRVALINQVGEATASRNAARDAARKSDTGGGSSKKSPAEELREYLDNLKDQSELERELVGFFGEKRTIEEAVIKARQKYGEATVATQEAELRGTLAQIEADKERQRVLEEAKQQQEEVASVIADNFGSAFMSIVDGTKTAKEAFKDMARSIIKQLFQILVVERMVKSIKSFISPSVSAAEANGGAWQGGSKIQAYANGGVVGGPTYFPMAGGKTGLMGEAGPEAIMPLKRGANGKLGVQAEGGGGTTVIQNNTFGSGVTRAEVNAMLPKMVEATKAAVADAKLRGGSYGGAFA